MFDTLRTTQEGFFGSWVRYGQVSPKTRCSTALSLTSPAPRFRQSKLANVVYAAELARRYPNILSVSVHPGVIETGLVTNLPRARKILVSVPNLLMGRTLLAPEQGCLNTVWCAAGARRDQVVNGAWYTPVGVMSSDRLDATARSPELASRLCDWTQGVLARY